MTRGKRGGGKREACFVRPSPSSPTLPPSNPESEEWSSGMMRDWAVSKRAWQDVRVISCKQGRDLSIWGTGDVVPCPVVIGMDGAGLFRIFRDKRKKPEKGRIKPAFFRLSPRNTLRNYVLSRKNVIYGVCSSFLSPSAIFFLCVFNFCARAHTYTYVYTGTLHRSLILSYDCMIIYPAFFFSTHTHTHGVVLLFRDFPRPDFFFSHAEFYDFRGNAASKDTTPL